jgi:hypothetical protein
VKVRQFAIVIVIVFSWLTFIGASSGITAADDLLWKTVEGIQQTSDVVGSGTGQVTGGAPWDTTGGSVEVDLKNGSVSFNVTGLVLAVGSVPSVPLTGLVIGSTAGVTEVKGTLVCNVDGKNGGPDSILLDTPSTTLDARGNAQFSGNFTSSVPSVCGTQSDDAFLIRIVQPADFADLWIAFGAIPTSSSCHHHHYRHDDVAC